MAFNHLTMRLPQCDIDAIRELGAEIRADFNENVAKEYQSAKLKMVEVGSWVGESTLLWAETFDKVFAVDAWDLNLTDPTIPSNWWQEDSAQSPITEDDLHQCFDVFCENCGHLLFTKIFPCRGKSATWARIWPGQVDLVYIDANHRYEEVKRDAAMWIGKVRPRGVLAFHDFGTYEGIVKFVNERFPKVEKKGNIAVIRDLHNGSLHP